MLNRVRIKPGPDRDPEPPLKTNWSAVFFLVVWTTFGLLIVHHSLN